MGKEGQWDTPTRKPDFLFLVHALSKVFRGKFMAALATTHRTGQIERDSQGHDEMIGASGTGSCINTTGWCMSKRRWADRPKCWRI